MAHISNVQRQNQQPQIVFVVDNKPAVFYGSCVFHNPQLKALPYRCLRNKNRMVPQNRNLRQTCFVIVRQGSNHDWETSIYVGNHPHHAERRPRNVGKNPNGSDWHGIKITIKSMDYDALIYHENIYDTFI